MKNLYLSCLFLCFTSSIFSQVWERVYQDTFSFLQGFRAEQTTDGGYIIIGESDYPTGAIRHYIHLIKTNSQGDKEWEKTLNTGSFFTPGYSEGRSIHVIDDGYLVGGTTHLMNIGKPAMALVKTDHLGDTIWTQTIAPPAYHAYGESVLIDQNGDYVIAGRQVTPNSSTPSILFAKTNPNGEILWTKTYFDNGNHSSELQSIQATNDQGYILAGTLDGKFFVMKTNMQGDSLWSKSFGLSIGDMAYSVAATNDGGYIVGGSGTGFAGHFPVILKLDENGNKVGETLFLSIGQGSVIDLIIDADQNIVATGSIRSFSSSDAQHGFLIKLDIDGNQLWVNDFSPIQKNYHGGSVRQTSDGGYIVGGSSHTGMLLLKTNSSGVFDPTASINLINGTENLQISPNPARDFFDINLGAQATGTFQIMLYDSIGRLVCRQSAQALNGGVLKLPTEHLAKAIYLVQVRQEGELLGTGKIVIQ